MRQNVPLTVLAGMSLSLSAMGLGFRIAGQDTAAIYCKPASISQIEGIQARANFYGIGVDFTYTAPEGVQTKTQYTLQGVPDFCSTTVLKPAPVTFFVSVLAPYGLEWPSGTTINPAPSNWNSSLFYEFDVSRYFDKNCHTTGGYIYSKSFALDATLSLIVPDSDRQIFSIGGGRTNKRWRWGTACQSAYDPSRTVTGNVYSLHPTHHLLPT